MAKDGTNRGGRRVRAGAKPDPLNEKLAAGRPAPRLEDPLNEPFDFEGSDIGDGEQLLLHFAVAGWGCDACGEKGIRGKDRLDAVGEPILLETGLGGDLVKRYEDLVDRMIAELTVVSFGSSGDVGEESWAVENSVVP